MLGQKKSNRQTQAFLSSTWEILGLGGKGAGFIAAKSVPKWWHAEDILGKETCHKKRKANTSST